MLFGNAKRATEPEAGEAGPPRFQAGAPVLAVEALTGADRVSTGP